MLIDRIFKWTIFRASKPLCKDRKEPKLDFFETLEDVNVEVFDCSVENYDSEKGTFMTLKDYLLFWRSEKNKKDGKILYLKNWHFDKDFPDIKLYSNPEYFTSDWLNEYLEVQSKDFKQLFLGPKNSWTHFHYDIFCSHAWAANIAGFKKWIIVQPEFEFKDVLDISEVLPVDTGNDVQEPFECKIHNDIRYFEVIQGPGDFLFIPSGLFQ